jgi:hypothetical protein
VETRARFQYGGTARSDHESDMNLVNRTSERDRVVVGVIVLGLVAKRRHVKVTEWYVS